MQNYNFRTNYGDYNMLNSMYIGQCLYHKYLGEIKIINLYPELFIRQCLGLSESKNEAVDG